MRSRCSWAVLAILATVGGCGGGDAEQPPAPDRPLTKHELIRRGDALCREFHAKTPDTADIQDFDDLQRQVEQVIALTEETLAKFERLKPPPGDENPIDSYLDIQREQLELLRGLHDAAESEDSADVQTYETEIGERGAQAESVAQGYGFKECGAAE